MSGAAFARHYGLKYATFANWRQKQRKGAESEEGQRALGPVRLFETVVERDRSGSAGEGGALVVELAGGARLRVGSAGQVELAAALLARMAGLGAGGC